MNKLDWSYSNQSVTSFTLSETIMQQITLLTPLEQVSVVIVDEDVAKELNESFMNKNYPADILSFPYPPEDGFGGEIILCPAEIERYAQSEGLPLDVRCAHLFVHGLIHLQGYDHQTSQEAAQMFEKEEALWSQVKTLLKYPWKINPDYTYEMESYS